MDIDRYEIDRRKSCEAASASLGCGFHMTTNDRNADTIGDSPKPRRPRRGILDTPMADLPKPLKIVIISVYVLSTPFVGPPEFENWDEDTLGDRVGQCAFVVVVIALGVGVVALAAFIAYMLGVLD